MINGKKILMAQESFKKICSEQDIIVDTGLTTVES